MRDPIERLAAGGLGFQQIQIRRHTMHDHARAEAEARRSTPYRHQIEAEGQALMAYLDAKTPDARRAAQAEMARLERSRNSGRSR